MNYKIAIIGGGNLGTALAQGLLNAGYKAANLTVTRRSTDALKLLRQKGVHVDNDNVVAVKTADIVILAVKPFQVLEVLKQIRPALKTAQLLASAVAGVSFEDINSVIKGKLPLCRVMPNTAMAINESMTCLSFNSTSPLNDKVTALFDKLGKTVVIEEKLMEAATILGACGTAYAMRYIRACTQGGIEIGFSASVASLIAAQTVKGAAELLLQNKTHPEEEIDKVTTPKGCTIVGLNQMEHNGFSSSLIRGIAASYDKIKKD